MSLERTTILPLPKQTFLGYPERQFRKPQSVGTSHPLKPVYTPSGVRSTALTQEPSLGPLTERKGTSSLESSRLNPTHGQVITKQSWDTSTHRHTAGPFPRGEEMVSPVGTRHTTTQFARCRVLTPCSVVRVKPVAKASP